MENKRNSNKKTFRAKLFRTFSGSDKVKRNLEQTEKFEGVCFERSEDEDCLGGGQVGTMPATVPGKPLKILVTEKIWSRTGISDAADKLMGAADVKLTWSVGPKEGKGKSAMGKSVAVTNPKNRRLSRLLILDRSGEKPLAVVSRNVGLTRNLYEVFGFHPMMSGQQPHLARPGHIGNATHDGKDLFLWAKVGAVLDNNSIGAITVALCTKKRGCFRTDAIAIEDLVRKMGVFEGDVRLMKKGGQTAGVLRRGRFPGEKVAPVGPVWECCIAPGIDPIMFICLVVIRDDLPNQSLS